MILSLAPMEGITEHTFRRVHAACFGKLDRYYIPFVVPPRVGSCFKGRILRELDPAANEGLDAVPQLITKNADEFVWAAKLLADMGYREVNLNAGCPSGTVVSKGKGAGFLRNPARLEALLDEVCGKSPLPVSVKTRIGFAADEEYDEILAIYCRYPLAELIVHPRVRADFYRNAPRQEAYGMTLAEAPFPVAYSGDIFSCAAYDELVSAYPKTRHAMLGRGIIANPALGRMVEGGPAATAEELDSFQQKLFSALEEEMGGNAVLRMKEWWSYARFAFAEPMAVQRAIRKVRKVAEYEKAASWIFQNLPLADEAVYHR